MDWVQYEEVPEVRRGRISDTWRKWSRHRLQLINRFRDKIVWTNSKSSWPQETLRVMRVLTFSPFDGQAYSDLILESYKLVPRLYAKLKDSIGVHTYHDMPYTQC